MVFRVGHVQEQARDCHASGELSINFIYFMKNDRASVRSIFYFKEITIMKRIVCLLISALLLFALVSCGSGNNTGSDSELSTIKEKGVIRVGMECDYAPFNWTQTSESENAVKLADGTYADGYDVRIASAIAAELGVELEIVKTSWDGLLPALTSGKIDAIIAGMSPTAERKETIDFSANYYTSELVIVVAKDGAYAGATSLSDFAGAKITGQHETFHYDVIDQIEGVDKQTAMKTFPDMIVALSSGKIDGYVSELPGALSAVSSNPDLTYVQFSAGNGFTASDDDISVAVGLRKGSDLTAEITRILSGISDDQRLEIMTSALADQPVSD